MVHPLSNIAVLDQFRETAPVPGYPTDRRRLFATQDNVHGAILYVVSSCLVSQTLSMYSLDDATLVTQIIANYHSVPGGMPTLITQDSSCYKTNEGKRVSAPLVALIGQPNFRWAVGTSDKGNISHTKAFVGDGSFTITGSTNWSVSGEDKEDNEIEFTINAVLAAEMTARIETQYAWMMQNSPQPSS